MRKLRLALLAAASCGLLFAADAQAQRKKPQKARGRLNAGFARGPAVGATLPDVAALDANGKPFSLRSLKGRHTVLVFGCLT